MRRAFLILLLLVCALPLGAQQRAAEVTILHFNDVYEIAPVEGGASGGLARVATLRAQLRAQNPAQLTTLGGDFLSPSALGTAVVDGQRLAGKQMVAVLNTLGLDWATFGNHEFDLAQPAFMARLAEATFHIVSSNVTDANGALFPGTVATTVVPLRTSSGIVRIGLLGLTIDSTKQPWVKYTDPIAAAKLAVAQLRGNCDAIVALTHLALLTDQALAEQVPEIDLILGGHEHENWFLRRGPRLTPIVKADANVRTVGVITLRIPRKGARPVISSRLAAIDATVAEGSRTAAEVRRWTELAFEGFRRVGFEPSQVVTTTTIALDGRESSVRLRATPLTDMIVESLRHEAGTDVGLINGGAIRIDDALPPGPITQYDVIRVLPFGDPILRATFTGALLTRVLQVGNQNRGIGGYIHYAGPATIDPAQQYTVALPEYMLTGAETNFGFLTRQTPGVSGVTQLRDVRLALIDELRRRFPTAR